MLKITIIAMRIQLNTDKKKQGKNPIREEKPL